LSPPEGTSANLGPQYRRFVRGCAAVPTLAKKSSANEGSDVAQLHKETEELRELPLDRILVGASLGPRIGGLNDAHVAASQVEALGNEEQA
jgi:hypothetical protein